MELVDDLFLPEMNDDRFRAKRGTAGAVVFLMVGKRVARSSQWSGW
jgi:hypothetical protein